MLGVSRLKSKGLFLIMAHVDIKSITKTHARKSIVKC